MRRLLIATMISAFCATMPLAQTTTPAPKPWAEPPGKPGTATYECSKQANAQRLSGEERKKFRAKCKKDFEKKT